MATRIRLPHKQKPSAATAPLATPALARQRAEPQPSSPPRYRFDFGEVRPDNATLEAEPAMLPSLLAPHHHVEPQALAPLRLGSPAPAAALRQELYSGTGASPKSGRPRRHVYIDHGVTLIPHQRKERISGAEAAEVATPRGILSA